jgi:hypothetical protein
MFALALFGVLLVGSILSYLALPGVRLGVDTRVVSAVKEGRRESGWGGYGAVRPVRTTASSQVADHSAPLLVDLINTDYWAADTAQDRQPAVTLTFARPTDLDYLLVTSGAGPDFGRMGRPKHVRLSYSDGSHEDLVLKDDPRAIGYEIHGYSVSRATLRVLSVYPSGQNSWVAMSELEFWRLG